MSDSHPLSRIPVKRKSGEEPFHCSGRPKDFDLISFWQWSVSDLVSNATRGRLAEYIVARALGLGVSDVRDEWAAYDLETPDGVKVEVKSAAYLQSWNQKSHSTIVYSVKKSRAWDPETNKMEAAARRQADVYVFALLHTEHKHLIDPLDLDQWTFFVVPTANLDARERSQHSITLNSLKVLAGEGVSFEQLSERVRSVAACPGHA